jgi:hypothetical protein
MEKKTAVENKPGTTAIKAYHEKTEKYFKATHCHHLFSA